MITNHYNFPETEFPKVGDFDLNRTYFVLGLRDEIMVTIRNFGILYDENI